MIVHYSTNQTFSCVKQHHMIRIHMNYQFEDHLLDSFKRLRIKVKFIKEKEGIIIKMNNVKIIYKFKR